MSSGEIWQQFGIATWRAHRARLQAMVFGWLSLMIAAAVLWMSGAMTPHIRWDVDPFFLFPQVDENGVLSGSIDIQIENEGLASFTLSDISAEMPGLRLLPGDEAKKEKAAVTVEGGGRGIYKGRVVITDCAAVPYEPRPIRFTYRTWLGSGSAEVTWDSWQLSGSRRALPVAWQRGMSGSLCDEAMDLDRP